MRNLLPQNQFTSQTCHKGFLGEGDSSEGQCQFPRGDYNIIKEIHLPSFIKLCL